MRKWTTFDLNMSSKMHLRYHCLQGGCSLVIHLANCTNKSLILLRWCKSYQIHCHMDYLFLNWRSYWPNIMLFFSHLARQALKLQTNTHFFPCICYYSRFQWTRPYCACQSITKFIFNWILLLVVLHVLLFMDRVTMFAK